MGNTKLHTYTIMSLDTHHIDEICEDIRYQYDNGIANYPLFSMTLVPEGNPAKNKAKTLCDSYKLFKEKLSSMNIPSGILVQASIGHDWVLSEMFGFQNVINLNDGKPTNVVCPYDNGFKNYIYQALKTIAECDPDCIMIDDDFRLIYRNGSGCACPYHLKRFNELSNMKLNRAELWEIISSGESEELNSIFIDTQKESLLETAKVMRDAIDSINPKIPGLFCCVGNNAEFAYDIASLLAGKGNPVVVRINNGSYCQSGTIGFSVNMHRAASQIEKLKNVDIILAETDTCPQNRYSTSAMMLHSHFTGTILEGAKGAKHWITRLSSYEPQSGEAYRNVLSKYKGFYEKLSELEPKLIWRGCRIPVLSVAKYIFGGNGYQSCLENDNAWNSCVLEYLGLPMYFSSKLGGITCLEGDIDKFYTDEEITELLSSNMFLSSDTAQNLINRGYSKYIGVEIKDWSGLKPSNECLYVNGNIVKTQMNTKQIIPINDEVLTDSMVCHSVVGGNVTELFPGVTTFKNKLGGKICVFSGTPRAKYDIVEAFSFLNYSRKQQIVSLMEQMDELPVYYPGDVKVYLKCADIDDGRIFVSMFNLSYDSIEKVELVINKTISESYFVTHDGNISPLSFSYTNNLYIFDIRCNPLEPIVLILK